MPAQTHGSVKTWLNKVRDACLYTRQIRMVGNFSMDIRQHRVVKEMSRARCRYNTLNRQLKRWANHRTSHDNQKQQKQVQW